MDQKKLKIMFIMTIVIIIILFTLLLTIFNITEGMNNYSIYNIKKTVKYTGYY